MMLSTTPASIIGADNKGSIGVNNDCDIVIWNDDYTVSTVIANGKIIN